MSTKVLKTYKRKSVSSHHYTSHVILMTYNRKRASSNSHISNGVLMTYKRNRVSSQPPTLNRAVADSSSRAPSIGIAEDLGPKAEATSENNEPNGDALETTSVKQQDICEPSQQETNKERAKQSSCDSEKLPPELESYKLSPNISQSGESPSNAIPCRIVAHMNNSEEITKPDPTTLVPSFVCEVSSEGISYQRDDSDDTVPEGQYANKRHASPHKHNGSTTLMTFHRRVKKNNLSELLTQERSKVEDVQCCSGTCTYMDPSFNKIPLPEEAISSLGFFQDNKMATFGTSSGLESVPPESSIEPKILILNGEHQVQSQPAEVWTQQDKV